MIHFQWIPICDRMYVTFIFSKHSAKSQKYMFPSLHFKQRNNRSLIEKNCPWPVHNVGWQWLATINQPAGGRPLMPNSTNDLNEWVSLCSLPRLHTFMCVFSGFLEGHCCPTSSLHVYMEWILSNISSWMYAVLVVGNFSLSM